MTPKSCNVTNAEGLIRDIRKISLLKETVLMAPPTVFSYLRRDHRRSSSPASPSLNPSSPSPPISFPSHLQGTTGNSPRSGTSSESSPYFESQTKHQLKPDHAPHTERRPVRAPFVPLQLPSSIHDPIEPHWGAVDPVKPVLGAQGVADAPKSPTLPRRDLSPCGSHKPSSPWKLAFGKSSSSDHSKYSNSTSNVSEPSGRAKLSPDNAYNENNGGTSSSKDMESPVGVYSNRRDGVHEANLADTAPSRHGKARLNLLNPMTLLARRRSGQFMNSRPEDIGKMSLPALPDDYDPRIRGKLFHDFSAPRPRSNLSTPTYKPQQTEKAVPQDTVQSKEKSLSSTPEHLKQSGHNHPQREVLPKEPPHDEDSRNSIQLESDDYFDSAPSSFRPSNISSSGLPSYSDQLSKGTPGTAKQPEQRRPGTMKSNRTNFSASLRSRLSSIHDNATPAAPGLPKHLTSSASRFSFDLAGVGSSSQEKLMEEKHKEKEAARKAEAGSDTAHGSDSDSFDYDAMMDDDGLEERIPGVNVDADADADDDDFDEFNDNYGMEGYSGPRLGNLNTLNNGENVFVPALPTVLSAPMSPLNLDSPATQPHNEDTQIEGPTKPSPGLPVLNVSSCDPLDDDPTAAPQPYPVTQDERQLETITSLEEDNDDLYFDDGMIDDIPPDTEGGTFDESIFDDETSHLYERRRPAPQNTLRKPKASAGQPPVSKTGVLETAYDHPSNGSHLLGGATEESEKTVTEDVAKADESQKPTQSLTEGNLEAYHSALAQAANEAALKGRFRRSVSDSEASDDRASESHTSDSHPGLTADGSRVSQNIESMTYDVLDDFDYDDKALDDDPMIAAANAEVLENDDEGFYGQEFGFYARAHGNCDPEMVFGGYFGPGRVEGITRSHSFRANFREPSLTPITERSEWSTRNSIISLTAHAHSGQQVSSPALAQLVDMGNVEDEMTLSSLMKLRRSAWGGSNGSLRSSVASQGATSPQTHQTPSNLGSFTSAQDGLGENIRPSNARTSPPGGFVSRNSYTSDSDFPETLPKIENQLPPTSGKPNHHRPPSLSIDTNKANVSKLDVGHSRTSSATESISYVKGTDESGSDCWVLEKRRTSLSGEPEIEREVMGRI